MNRESALGTLGGLVVASYQLVNGTFLVPSAASDQYIRIYFTVKVPRSVGRLVLSEDEDISAAGYVIQDHFMKTHGFPVLETWPSTLSLAPDAAPAVLTREALDMMKRRLQRHNES